MPSSRNKTERLALPDVVNPLRTLCFKLQIPDDPGYLAAFYGAIGQLAQWRTWEQDDAHTGKDVAAVWRAIYFALKPTTCVDAQGSAGADEGEPMLRQSPDNPCLLETSVDGVTWCAWADLSLCLGANPPQPSGGGQPAVGDCNNYRAELAGNGQWLLPFQVNAGDTVTITDRKGAWTDGSGLWFCTDGKHYALGICGSASGTSGGDPLPTAQHASVIGYDGTNYYDFASNSITIESGISNANFVLLMNDPSPSDNAGTITLLLSACHQNADNETIVLNSTDQTVHSTSFNGDPAKTYKITFDGFIHWNYGFDNNKQGDAFYGTTDAFATHSRYADTPNVCGTGYLEIAVNGASAPAIPAYDSGHHYEIMLVGTGSPFTFQYCDQSGSGSDNNGSFTINIQST